MLHAVNLSEIAVFERSFERQWGNSYNNKKKYMWQKIDFVVWRY